MPKTHAAVPSSHQPTACVAGTTTCGEIGYEMRSCGADAESADSTCEAPGTGAEAAAAATTAVVEASCSAAAGAVLTVSPHKKAVLVTGETQKVKELLKALKGSWNKGLGGWCFPGSQRAAVLAALRKARSPEIPEVTAPRQVALSPPRTRPIAPEPVRRVTSQLDREQDPTNTVTEGEAAAQPPAKRQKGSAASEGGFINDDDSE